MENAIKLARRAKKFLLPVNGRLHDDKKFQGLDENEPLKLPFPVIALEYRRTLSHHDHSHPAQGDNSSKAIVFAEQQEDKILITPIMWVDRLKMWAPFGQVALPLTQYVDRTMVQDGRVAIKIGLNNLGFPMSDYADEVGTLLCMLSCLACSNVSMHKSKAKSPKVLKGALPFDSYHMLTIDVSAAQTKAIIDNIAGNETGQIGRHKREYVRRGHIRRIAKGPIWVNAHIVNVGIGAKIHKDYMPQVS